MGILSNTNMYIQKAIEVHGTRYDYSLTEYLHSRKNVTIICKTHGPFSQSAYVHLSGSNCPQCSSIRVDFFDKAKEVHGDVYDYSNTIFLGIKKKLTIRCLIHGNFEQIADNHLLGKGCIECGHKKTSTKRTSNTASFVEKAKLKHGNRYDYSRVEYTTSHNTINIVCEKHGVFEQIASNHIQGAGCQECDKTIWSTELFISKSKEIFPNKYQYTKSKYTKYNERVIITCRKHGDFEQSPTHHFASKEGCKKCQKWKSQDLWLDKLGVPNDFIHREVKLPLKNGKKIRADGYDPKTNTIYEYWGTFYHGHPDYYASDFVTYMGKTSGELYQATLDKINSIHEAGYNLVQIWDHEFRKIKQKPLNIPSTENQ